MSRRISIIFFRWWAKTDTSLSEIICICCCRTCFDTGSSLIFCISFVCRIAFFNTWFILKLSIQIRIPRAYCYTITCRWIRILKTCANRHTYSNYWISIGYPISISILRAIWNTSSCSIICIESCRISFRTNTDTSSTLPVSKIIRVIWTSRYTFSCTIISKILNWALKNANSLSSIYELICAWFKKTF